MTKTRTRAAAIAASGLIAAAAAVPAGMSGSAQAAATTQLSGSAVPATAEVGPVPAAQPLTVQVWLKPDLAGAAAFASAVATPGRPAFHDYLSPDAYTARFGPSAAQAAAVSSWLAGAGLTGVQADSGRDYVSATGPAAAIESAFHVRVNQYRVEGADGKPVVIESNDRAVSVPAALAPDVLSVTGLDSAPAVTSAEPAAKTASCSRYWAQYVKSYSPSYRGLTKGAIPVCGYSASQLRSVYDATTAAVGKGVKVALTEEEAPVAMLQTLKDYAKDNRLPAPASAQLQEKKINFVPKGGCGSSAGPVSASPVSASPVSASPVPASPVPASPVSASPVPASPVPASPVPASADFFDDESQLDSEALYAMAPGASQLMVIGAGCNEDQDLLDALLAVLTGNGSHPSASIVSNSWQIPVGDVSAQTVHAIDVRAADEGVGVYFASGDTSGLAVTAADPDVTAVGGTTLGIGKKYNRVFETGWSDDFGALENGKWSDVGAGLGAGGGTSLVWKQPTYQKGVVPASMSQVRVGQQTVTDRAGPDIAADADSDSGMLAGYIASGSASHPGPYQTEPTGGTSLATPLIAGLVADAQQGQKTAFGFLNPLIYRLAGTKALRDVLPVTDALPQPDRDAYEAGGDGFSIGVDVFDSQGKRYSTQVTAKGYDTMTGVGTPSGSAFIAALRAAASKG